MQSEIMKLREVTLTSDEIAMALEPSHSPLWWHGKIAYQIYPRSFMDSNGDGIGDLKGITSRLDHLQSLGIDIIWLSPIFKSPMVDAGYDISDYRAINPEFGSMEDFDELLAEIKKRGMHLILDLVVNHCSSENALFKKALLNPEGPEAQYFYFVKGKNPPDNLRSYFGGSVWEKVPGDNDYYYLHYFAKEQPDLNWYNKELRLKIYDMVNFWLDKGIDGFRVDAIMNVAKDTTFPGLPPDDAGDGMAAAKIMTAKHAHEVPKILHEFRERCIKPHNALTVGEAFGLNEQILPAIYGEDGIFSSVFDFTAREIFDKLPGYYAYYKGTVKIYRDNNFKGQLDAQRTGMASPILENHDEPRAVSFYLPPSLQNSKGAKALATAFIFLRGLPFIYQGQEIGMTNTDFKSLEEFKDLVSHQEYNEAKRHGFSDEEALQIIALQARDNARTPMLWDDSDNAGFSTTTPWMRMHQDFKSLNVAAQKNDPDSPLSCYKELIKLRKSPEFQKLFTYGVFIPILSDDDGFIAYNRRDKQGTITVYANLAEHELEVPVNGEIIFKTGDITLENKSARMGSGSALLFFNQNITL